MAIKRITMQDIADSCGLSRNTVSKIFNGRGTVPEATKELVYRTAQELGYSQIPTMTTTPITKVVAPALSKVIAVLSHSNHINHHFGSFFIKAFSDQICRSGHVVKLYEISTEELEQKILPPYISPENTAGILCIELFDKDFLKLVCDLNLPTLIVDGSFYFNRSLLSCDYISMENIGSSINLTQHLISMGARKIGFVGDIFHCNSFHERWEGFSFAMNQAELKVDKSICILDDNAAPYSDYDWLSDKLNHMPFIPDAFVCANDFHAIHMINVLKRHGLNIPDDVMIVGFDNSPESRIIDPNITTANIPSSDIGIQAAEILLARISNPERSYISCYVKTTPIFRGSTQHR